MIEEKVKRVFIGPNGVECDSAEQAIFLFRCEAIKNWIGHDKDWGYNTSGLSVIRKIAEQLPDFIQAMSAFEDKSTHSLQLKIDKLRSKIQKR